jgi:O-antigen/teichoic acid export membrane protein
MRIGRSWRRAVTTLRSDVGVAFWPFTDQVMVSGSNLLISIVIARSVGAYQFGLYALAWSYVLITLSLQQSFIGAPLFNLAPRRPPQQRHGYISVLVAEQLILAGVFFVVTWLGAGWGRRLFAEWAYGGYALALAAAGAGYLWQDFMRRCLFARGRARTVLFCDAIAYPGQLLGLLLAARGAAGLNAMLWVVAAGFWLSAAVAVTALGPLRLPRGEVRAIAAEQWGYARWLVGAVMLNEISRNAAYLVFGAVLGASSVAGMRAAELLFRIGNPFYQSLENFLPSHATRLLLDQGLPAFASYMRRWTVLALGISSAISLVAVAAPGFWLGLLFGPQMAGYGNLVYALAVRNPLLLLTVMGSIVLRSRDATPFATAAEACRAGVAAATVYPIAASFGVVGAAIAYATWPLAALPVMAAGIRKSLRPSPQIVSAAAADGSG